MTIPIIISREAAVYSDSLQWSDDFCKPFCDLNVELHNISYAMTRENHF